ncbi:MAG TPA: type II secretion system F family protein [Alphaproteobacteria bacterium]
MDLASLLPAGEDGLILIVTVSAVAFLMLLAGAALTARQGGAVARRIQSVRARHGSDRKAAAHVAIRRTEPGGVLNGLGRAAGRWLPRRAALQARLARTGYPITIGHYFLAVVAIGVLQALTSGMLFGLSPMLAGLTGITQGLLLPHLVIGFLGRRRLKRFVTHFPEAIDLIVRGLRSGLPVSESIGVVGREVGEPVGPEFRLVDQSVRLGRSIEEALWDAAQRIDIPEFKFFIISLSVQRETGGNLAETLENLSDILRRRRQMQLKIKALSSEARASAMIIGSLPFIMFGILMLVNGDYVMDLFRDPRGMVMVGVGLFFMTIGILVMAKMVRFEI